ncbi:uncharacterized protein LOC135954694 [Calliphora vicina]|uniref:uncharacterized protein LOC135954694 n=1 Tax=Calliphora vicina TaxID=7373 RepID=UPI00325B31F2
MTKTSHKKNRPFDFKLIDLVEPHPILYLRQIPGMSTFEMMKTKSTLWQEIAEEMGFPVQFCLNRWNNLRGQFQKELKHSNELCPKSGLIRGSTWPYLTRLRFLESTVQSNKPKKEKLSKRKLKELEEMEQESVWKSDDSDSRHIDEQDNDYNIDDLTDTVQNSNVIEETYIGDEDYSIIEEIAEEVVGTEAIEQTENFALNNTIENYRKMQTLLSNFEEDSLQTIERRLMAFLCKCQLRALSEQTIDDLYV